MRKVDIFVSIAFCMLKVVLSETIYFETDSAVHADGHVTEVKRSLHEDEALRYRREARSGLRNSCKQSSQCSNNKTRFDTTSVNYNCYCDSACYETFQDCCSDYVENCGHQKRPKPNAMLEPLWKCLKPDKTRLGYEHCWLEGPVGIWMVVTCLRKWPFDETRAKCENSTQKFSHPIEDFLPVVGQNEFTYRNKHCALCNGEKVYKNWDVSVKGFTTPPESFNLDDKLKFILANRGYIRYIAPGVNLPRRYCAGEKYINNCTFQFHPAYTRCINGPVETVRSSNGLYYKNVPCAFCNGESSLQKRRSESMCGAPGFAEGLSIVFSTGSKDSLTTTKIIEQNCPQGLVYDTTFHYCREGLVTTAEGILSEVFLIVLWFEQGSIEISSLPFNPFQRRLGEIPNIENITEHLKSGLVRKFALKPNQIHEIKFHRQNFRSTILVATFRLTLSPLQALVLANQNNTLNVSTESLKFLGLLKFTTNFTIHSEGFRYPVIKLVSRQLACFEGIMLEPHQYEIDKISGNVFQNNTGLTFPRNAYTILGNIGENITICRKLVLGSCENGAHVTLNNSEYFMYKNLSIFHHGTNRTYHFGEYQIIEGSPTHPTRFQEFQNNTSFPKNSRISVCLPFRRTFNTTEKVSVKSETNFALRILTVVGLSISGLFLIVLLVTYGIFEDLRTLPGLNLMSLSISMLLSHVIWLVGTAHFKGTAICEALAVIEHYLFLVTFVGMSAISYHSCVIFSQVFARNSGNRLRQFAKYSTIVWLTPAIFIAACIALDKTEKVFDVYGTTCWLSTHKAVLYLFLLPAAVILSGNIYTFIKTALAISRFDKDTSILRKDRKKNLVICAKLATLVGFPWIFAFFGVIFPDVEVFEFLFVIFTSLQGAYIGVAFVCNKKTVQLYKKWFEIGAEPRNETFQMS